MKKSKEKGSASFNLELENSIITMRHGTDNTLLHQFNAVQGDWKKICDFIRGFSDAKSNN